MIHSLGGFDRVPALPERRRPLPPLFLGLLGFLLPLGQDLGVLGRGLSVLLSAAALERQPVTLPLQHGGSDEALDLGRLVALLLILLALLCREWPLDDILAHVVLLRQHEKLPDLGRPLGPKPAGLGVVRQAGDLRLSLLHNDHGEDGQVGVDDAAPDGLALLLAGAPLAEASVALLEEESDAAVGEDALLHGEALLVVAARDAEGVALPLVAQARRVHVLTHALLVEWANLVFIVDLEELLAPRRREGHVQLHGELTETETECGEVTGSSNKGINV